MNKRLSYDEDEVCYGGENHIMKMGGESTVKLPDDYIQFLRCISGGDNVGICFSVDNDSHDIYIWSASVALQRKNEDFNFPNYQDFLKHAWLIGDDVGDLVYFYGEGNDGFGLYRGSVGALSFNNAKKIADSLTDFLVNGVGIGVAVTL